MRTSLSAKKLAELCRVFKKLEEICDASQGIKNIPIHKRERINVLMTAEEARSIADKSEVAKILKSIKDQAYIGYKKMVLMDRLLPDTIKVLKSLGYTIKPPYIDEHNFAMLGWIIWEKE